MPSESSKQRKSRIALEYYRRADPIVRARNAITLLAVIAALLWLIFPPSCHRAPNGSLRTLEIARLASPGPLAADHATWDAACEACHTPFQAINRATWSPALVRGHTSDKKCSECHQVGDHHANQDPDDLPACAECHRDHQGRETSLVSRDDAQCTRCHADLRNHRSQASVGEPAIAPKVTRFARGEHPEFFWAREEGAQDPGRLRFNHAVHLAPGLTLEPGGKPFTYGRIAPTPDGVNSALAGGKQDPVQLACASCHRLEPNARMGFLPITYERDCRACHALDFDPAAPTLRAPHGNSIQETIALLRDIYEGQALEENPDFLRQVARPRAVPDKPVSEESRRLNEVVDAKTLAATRLLLAPNSKRGCLECHEIKDLPAAPFTLEALQVAHIVPPEIPTVWSPRSRFDHDSHRALDCATCHPGATTSTTHTDLMLPRLNDCLTCHAAASSPIQVTGAGNACTECHAYHHMSGFKPNHPSHLRWGAFEFLEGRRDAQNP